MIHKLLLIVLLVLGNFTWMQAQITDNIIWASVKVQKNINKKTSFAIAPIVRLNDDISNYQNMSIDVSAKHLLGQGWHIQLLARTWFMPDRSDRQFLWFDVGYGRDFGKMKISSSLRLHYAFNIKDRPDGDFLRWKTTLFFPKIGQFRPFIAYEPWFGFNKANEFQRVRYEPGINYQLSEQFNLIGVYRREESRNLEPTVEFNMYVITLVYRLK